MDPQIFQKGVQRTPKFENLDTSLRRRIQRRYSLFRRLQTQLFIFYLYSLFIIQLPPPNLRTNLIFRNTFRARNTTIYTDVVKQLKERLGSRGENFSFNVTQTKNKFKKCVAECKKAALTTGHPGSLCVGKCREHIRRSLGLKIC